MVMIASRMINVLLVCAWVLTQTTMSFAHLASVDHTHQSAATHATAPDLDHSMHQGHDHGALLADGEQLPPHSGMSSMECCGNSCTLEAFGTDCALGLGALVRLFDDAKIASLSGADLDSANPPPNTTI